MRRYASAFLIILSTAAVAANAQSARTFVSAAAGSDSNNCSRLAPCRTFGAAIANTTSGGEVIALDSGGYGPVTITSSVSIVAPAGIYAGITAPSGNAITIDLGSGVVALRGLTLNGIGATNGIGTGPSAVATTQIYVDACSLRGFGSSSTGAAINIASLAQLFVTDTTASDCANGIIVGPFGTAALEDVRIGNAAYGLSITNSKVVAHDVSVSGATSSAFNVVASSGNAKLSADQCAAGAGAVGFFASGSGGTAEIDVTNSTMEQNAQAGILVNDLGGLVLASNNTIVHNAVGIQNNGDLHTLQTPHDNDVYDNTQNVIGAMSLYQTN